jgi:hypothetical protein
VTDATLRALVTQLCAGQPKLTRAEAMLIVRTMSPADAQSLTRALISGASFHPVAIVSRRRRHRRNLAGRCSECAKKLVATDRSESRCNGCLDRLAARRRHSRQSGAKVAA